MRRGRVSLARRAAAVAVVAGVMAVAVEEATEADAGTAGKDAAANPNNLAKGARCGGRLFYFREKNSRTAAIGLSFELHFDYNQTKRKEFRDLCLTNQTHKKKEVHNHPRRFRFHQSRSKQPVLWPALRSAVWPARSARSWAESSVLSQEEPPLAAGRSFLLLRGVSPRLLNVPNRALQKSVPVVRRQKKDQHGDRPPQNRGNVRSAADDQYGGRLPQNRGNVPSAADGQQKAAEDRNLRAVVGSGATRAAGNIDFHLQSVRPAEAEFHSACLKVQQELGRAGFEPAKA
jgi:hypothetical protein